MSGDYRRGRGSNLARITIILILVFMNLGVMFTKNKTKFDWTASESAPKYFPMRVIDGTFVYHGEKGGLYVPAAASIGYFWGTGESTHVVGEQFKPLPDRLEIKFFSFTENKLYQGSFPLPYDKILALFQEGVARRPEMPIFQKIIVGMAPGGAVAVWVSGKETREVFFGQADPYEADISNPMGSLIKDRAAYARSYLEDLPAEAQANLQKNGVPFGRWAKYRKPYTWNVTIKHNNTNKDFGYSFFNGESYRLNYPLGEAEVKTPKPLPLLISFRCTFPGEQYADIYVVHFNDDELFAAFEKLSALQEPITFEIDPNLLNTTPQLVFLTAKRQFL